MLSEATFTGIEAALITTHEAEYGAGSAAAIPWAQIIAIFTQLLSGCIKPPTPADVRQAVADKPRFLKFAVIEGMGLRGYRQHNGDGVCRTITRAMTGDAPAVTDPMLASFCAEAA